MLCAPRMREVCYSHLVRVRCAGGGGGQGGGGGGGSMDEPGGGTTLDSILGIALWMAVGYVLWRYGAAPLLARKRREDAERAATEAARGVGLAVERKVVHPVQAQAEATAGAYHRRHVSACLPAAYMYSRTRRTHFVVNSRPEIDARGLHHSDTTVTMMMIVLPLAAAADLKARGQEAKDSAAAAKDTAVAAAKAGKEGAKEAAHDVRDNVKVAADKAREGADKAAAAAKGTISCYAV